MLSVAWSEPWTNLRSSWHVPKLCFVNQNLHGHLRHCPMWMFLVFLLYFLKLLMLFLGYSYLLIFVNISVCIDFFYFFLNRNILQGHWAGQNSDSGPSNCWGRLGRLCNALIHFSLLWAMKTSGGRRNITRQNLFPLLFNLPSSFSPFQFMRLSRRHSLPWLISYFLSYNICISYTLTSFLTKQFKLLCWFRC